MRDSQSLCVVDANVLIDLHVGRLLADLCRLQCRMIVPDVIAAELIDPDGTRLAEAGLEVHEFSGDQVLEVIRLRPRFNQVSTNDLFALVLAKALEATLLTGDRHLRQIADGEGMAVHGTLWVLDKLVQLRIINPRQASAAMRRMLDQGRRLPMIECEQRFRLWKETGIDQ
jgi:predicted nucleic acid-binding protein